MTHYIIHKSNKIVKIGKIICLARSYKKHAMEMHSEVTENPLFFLKPETAVIFNNESIIIPKMSNCVHYEAEMGVVIGKTGKNIPQNKALDHVLGYLIALDITARDIQSEAKKHGFTPG